MYVCISFSLLFIVFVETRSKKSKFLILMYCTSLQSLLKSLSQSGIIEVPVPKWDTVHTCTTMYDDVQRKYFCVFFAAWSAFTVRFIRHSGTRPTPPFLQFHHSLTHSLTLARSLTSCLLLHSLLLFPVLSHSLTHPLTHSLALSPVQCSPQCVV